MLKLKVLSWLHLHLVQVIEGVGRRSNREYKTLINTISAIFFVCTNAFYVHISFVCLHFSTPKTSLLVQVCS